MNKWSCKNPLTLQQRKEIQDLESRGFSSREIGGMLSRAKSTILRELKRLGIDVEYDPDKAQQDFERKQYEGREKCRQTKKRKNRMKQI